MGIMAQGLLTVGFTLQEVHDIQGKAKALVLEGKTIMQCGERGNLGAEAVHDAGRDGA